jgi:hypothetical protein
MQIPAELTKDEQKIRADLAAVPANAATYEKSLVAFVIANVSKVIVIALTVAVPVALIAYEIGKHTH